MSASSRVLWSDEFFVPHFFHRMAIVFRHPL